MKKIFKLLSKICIAALLGLGLFKSYTLYTQNILEESRKKKAISLPSSSFVILVPAHNPGFSCEKNLFSILTQNYENFRVVYLDDHSTDGSFEKAQSIASYLGKKEKITLLQIPENQVPLESIYQTIQNCKNDEIVLIINSTDFLAHENVLSKLNQLYATPFTWMTYGNFLDYPSYKQIPVLCKPFEKNAVFNNSYRSHDAPTLYPVTFYAALFKKIHLQDLLYQSHFIQTDWNWAYILPLLEMSGKHARFVNEVFYLYNKGAENKTTPYESEDLENLKKLPKYKRLKTLSIANE